ncbi:MAG: parallel beta-helix domain-containing protein [Pseudomonadales bacterium]
MRASIPAVSTLLLLLLLLVSCGQGEQATPASAAAAAEAPPASYEEQLRLALEEAVPGDVITIPAGTHHFTRSLTLHTSGVTLRGAGIDASVLSFRDQLAGAEGLLVTGSDFTIEDLAIEDTVGDALKVNGGSNIIIRRVRTEWTRGPHTDNGAYGIYPVQTENTLIEASVAIGASDAGIYVGQSRNVIVRNNRAERNVAGIEVENTVGADVYGNVARNNTGGILVFNMPDLPMAGHSTRVFDNEVVGNNTANFGTPGSAVADVPAGTGILINSNDKVEVFGNRIGNNNTANVIVSSLFSAEYTSGRDTASSFDPYPEMIYLYDNQFEPGGSAPDREALDALRRQAFGDSGSLPDIVWDGVVDPEKSAQTGLSPQQYALCIDNPGATFINVDAGNGYQNPSTDLAPHACQHAKLAAVDLALGS